MKPQNTERTEKVRKLFSLLALIAAGETVFFLPFLIARVFRPTTLELFDLTNLELGTAFSVYGIIAMIAYLLGGPVADIFNPRKLLATALVMTAAGGIFLATFPSFSSLKFLYAYWGFTTIALFWAALMRATREWGGEFKQGSAFGLLDGGRGLLAALTGSFMVAVYAFLLPDDIETASIEQRRDIFRQIILLITLMIFATTALVLFALPKNIQKRSTRVSEFNLRGVLQIFKMPTVWLQAFIIICAYVGFKSTDDFSLYASDVLHLNEVQAARASTVSLWVRPVAAILAGFLADRTSAGFMTIVSFSLLFLGSLGLGCNIIQAGMLEFFLLAIICASLGIFALRGLYFAIMKEGRVPILFTGSAVGFVSFLGYTPDVFMGPAMGYLLDNSPGAKGHQHVFLLVAVFAFAGLLASMIFYSITRAKRVKLIDLSNK